MWFFGLEKLAYMFRIFRTNGGLSSSWYKMWRYDTLKDGKLMGWDSYGNRYYQNNYYMMPRNRWVEIYDNCGWNYDGSHVTCEWYGWLHHKTDKVPCQDEAKRRIYCCPLSQKWLMPHVPNNTGTPRSFYPYSTVPSPIYVWDG